MLKPVKFFGVAIVASLLFVRLSFAESTQVLVVVGPSTHPPGTHEVAASALLIEHCLENNAQLAGIEVNVLDQWPHGDELLEKADSVVFVGDTFPAERMPDSDTIMADLQTMMSRGCGIVCLHFATGLLGEDVPADGDHPLLHWMGGYFANKSCAHHQSIARVFDSATITPKSIEHPILRGWQPFTLNDEPYINNYFGPDANKPAANVTVLATSMLPPESPSAEPVAWCIDRTDGGRGFAIVMPHFYGNWVIDDLRCVILNGIAWSAKLEVPAGGLRTASPDLEQFKPASVKPLPKK